MECGEGERFVYTFTRYRVRTGVGDEIREREGGGGVSLPLWE